MTKKSLFPGMTIALLMLMLQACTTASARSDYRATSQPVSQSLPSTKIYFYPLQGQSEQQQDRDRYECHLWAVKQSGYDPTQAQLAPHQRVEVIAEPTGEQTAAGAVTGAIAGSIISGPRHGGEGLILGAIAGAILGSAADNANAETRAQNIEDQINAERYAALDQQARDFRRAMTACLEGRGYSVQ